MCSYQYHCFEIIWYQILAILNIFNLLVIIMVQLSINSNSSNEIHWCRAWILIDFALILYVYDYIIYIPTFITLLKIWHFIAPMGSDNKSMIAIINIVIIGLEQGTFPITAKFLDNHWLHRILSLYAQSFTITQFREVWWYSFKMGQSSSIDLCCYSFHDIV